MLPISSRSVDYHGNNYFSVAAGAAATLLLGVAFQFLARRYWEWKHSPLLCCPHPPNSNFLWGQFFVILREPYMEPHKRWIRLFLSDSPSSSSAEAEKSSTDATATIRRPPPLIAYSSLLGKWSLLVLDCDVVKAILTESSSREPVRFPKNYFFIQEIIGHGLVSLEGQAWSRHRRIVQPAFQINFLRGALDRTVPVCTERLIQAWRTAAGAVIDLSAHMSALTLDVIGDVAFSHDFQGLQVIEDWAEQVVAAQNTNAGGTAAGGEEEEHKIKSISDPMLHSLQASLKVSVLAVVLNLFNLTYLEKYLNRNRARTRRLLNEAVDDIVREARFKNKTMRDSSSSGPSETSLLQLLFKAEDQSSSFSNAAACTDDANRRKHLSDLELRDEMKTFIVAGHETTSTWCYWALYALAKYPDVQEKVVQDILMHASSDKAPSLISLVQADSMEYLCAFLNEVLRFFSPVGAIVRFTSQTEHWKAYTIPAKTRLVIPIHLLHRHPDHWERSDEFQPERWLDKDAMDRRHKFSFLPFSAGGRNCIGQRFAEIEAKLIIANIARAFLILVAPCTLDQEITFTSFVTMKSKPPIKIIVKPR
jgi:cytochrome P450